MSPYEQTFFDRDEDKLIYGSFIFSNVIVMLFFILWFQRKIQSSEWNFKQKENFNTKKSNQILKRITKIHSHLHSQTFTQSYIELSIADTNLLICETRVSRWKKAIDSAQNNISKILTHKSINVLNWNEILIQKY